MNFRNFFLAVLWVHLGRYPQCHKDLPVMFLQLLEGVYSILYAPLSYFLFPYISIEFFNVIWHAKETHIVVTTRPLHRENNTKIETKLY